jgi:hypothetical protein
MLQRIEYIPQRVELIEGKPANIAGEWPGIKSSHWNGSLKVINQIRDASFYNPNPSLPLLGRRHYEERKSKEWNHFHSKKLIAPIKKEDKQHGLKRLLPIEHPYDNNLITKNRLETPGKRDNLTQNYNKFMPSKKKFGEKYTTFTQEKLINDELGKKRKIYSVEDRRNGMSVRAPGDKIYKNPEFEDKFFQKGGLAVGSTNAFNYKKTLVKGNNNFYETLDLKVKTLNDQKTWEFKERFEDLQYQTSYVKNLNAWEESMFGKIEEEKVAVIEKGKVKDNKVVLKGSKK